MNLVVVWFCNTIVDSFLVHLQYVWQCYVILPCYSIICIYMINVNPESLNPSYILIYHRWRWGAVLGSWCSVAPIMASVSMVTRLLGWLKWKETTMISDIKIRITHFYMIIRPLIISIYDNVNALLCLHESYLPIEKCINYLNFGP